MASVDFNTDFKIPFRNYVLADSGVSAVIGVKFFGAQLATLFNPTFPCAVFYQDAGVVRNLGIVQQFALVIRAYSDETYDQAYAVYAAIDNILGGPDGPISIPHTGAQIIIRPISTPTETYEREPRIYGVGSRFGVTWIS